MLKLVVGVLAAALAVSSAGARATVIGPDASACGANAAGPAMLVQIDGLKSRTGLIRVQSYGGNPGTYFNKGAYLRRVETPIPVTGEVDVCIPVPATGSYAISVRHDVDGSGSTGSRDGGGMSGNPRMSFWDVVMKRKPDPRLVQVSVHGVVRVPIVMNYVKGMSFGPLAMASR
jgi:uncharacterized protein (DUF2141 family)